jgi:hypothetical protein
MLGLKLDAWLERDCVGKSGGSTFPEQGATPGTNVSNWGIFQSLRLNRSLTDQEQLDISVASDLSTWYSNKDQFASCNIFLQTFTALNDLNICVNVSNFTCHRIWING